VINVGRYAVGLVACLLARTAPLAIAITAMALFAAPAHAQNLIKDPYFTNGVPQSGSTDSVGNGYYTSGATSSTFGGFTGATLTGSQYGYIEVYPLAGYDSSGVNYVFAFLAAALNPDIPTTVFAQFGYTTGPSSAAFTRQSLTGSGLTQFSLAGTSTNTNGNLGYLYVQAYGGGDVFVTGLDFQAAPAPVTGGGVLSFGIVLAGLAAHRYARRKAA
jgi:hypothetical protein